MSIWALFAMEALCMGFLHYFPWRKALRSNAEHPTAAIISQVVSFNLILSFWLIERGDACVVAVLWLCLGILGLVRLVLWLIDDYIDARLRAFEAEQREQLLRSTHDQTRG